MSRFLPRRAVLIAGIALIGLFIGLTGCRPDSSDDSGTRVVATTTMLGDVANRLLDGTGIEVVTLISPGVDPHTYELKATDAARLDSADLVVFNGLNLEGKMSRVLAEMENSVSAEQLIPATELRSVEGYENSADPHVWMDVGLWAQYVVSGLAEDFSGRWPEHASQIRTNAAGYLAELAALDDYARTAIGLIPEGQRHLVTAHDAFGYFGRAYGIDVRGVQGISTASQAGVRDVEELTRFIVEKQLPAVFIESSVGTKPVEKLQEGVVAAGHELELAPAIFSDSTGPGDLFEGTYVGMIDHNITTIARELGAPGIDIHGHSGKLTLGHDHDHEE
jgi:manganese/zinc/iron transport system substrate-binding protein